MFLGHNDAPAVIPPCDPSGLNRNDAPALLALARVPGWLQSEYEFDFQPRRRGIYPRESPVLTTGFPFGIWQSETAVPTARPLVVWTPLIPLTSAPVVGGDRQTVAGRFVDDAGDDGDIIGARLYRQGDSLRRIHWHKRPAATCWSSANGKPPRGSASG